MRFGTLQLCDEHARQSAAQTSTKVDPFYAAIWSLFNLRLTLGAFCIASFVVGYMRQDLAPVARIVTGAAGIALLHQGLITDAIGLCLFIGVWFVFRPALQSENLQTGN